MNGMHGLGVVDGRSAIPEGDGGRDPMHADVGWPERGEVVIGVDERWFTDAERFGGAAREQDKAKRPAKPKKEPNYLGEYGRGS
jgi:hypothetical protein